MIGKMNVNVFKEGKPVKVDHGSFDLLKMREIITTEKDSYELLQNGPALTFYHLSYFLKSYEQIKNPLLYYFVDMSAIMHSVLDSNDPEYRKTVQTIFKVINRASARMDLYADCVRNHGIRVVEGIQENRKEPAKESAMLSYRPIVPYCGSLVKYEYTDLHKRDYIEMDDLYQVRRLMDETIQGCLRDHIMNIMSFSTKWEITNHTDLVHAITEYNKMEEKDAEFFRWILNYRIAVFIKYKVEPDPKATFNILNACNTMSNGGKIDVEKWVSCFDTH